MVDKYCSFQLPKVWGNLINKREHARNLVSRNRCWCPEPMQSNRCFSFCIPIDSFDAFALISDKFQTARRDAHRRAQGCSILTEAVVGTAALSTVGAVAVDLHASGRAGTSSQGRVAAEHGDAGSVLGATKRHHVLANVGGDDLTVMGARVGEDVLDEVVAELVTSNYPTVSNVTCSAQRKSYCQSTACADAPDDPRRRAQDNGQGTRCRQS